jgi:hypothetical protein
MYEYFSSPVPAGLTHGSEGRMAGFGWSPERASLSGFARAPTAPWQNSVGKDSSGRTRATLQRAEPNFRFKCTIGCPPFPSSPPGLCHEVLRQAILDACKFALDAAAKLEAKPRDAATVNHFTQVYGHDPSQPFPWACQSPSGDIVACQFRMVAEALQKGGTLYRCDQCPPGRVTDCDQMGTQLGIVDPGRTVPSRCDPMAIVDTAAIALVCRNEVLLCPPFWHLSRFLRAGAIIHEMFHLRFPPFFQHCPKEKRGTSAYCYEAFALLVAGQPLSQILKVLNECQARPIA